MGLCFSYENKSLWQMPLLNIYIMQKVQQKPGPLTGKNQEIIL